MVYVKQSKIFQAWALFVLYDEKPRTVIEIAKGECLFATLGMDDDAIKTELKSLVEQKKIQIFKPIVEPRPIMKAMVLTSGSIPLISYTITAGGVVKAKEYAYAFKKACENKSLFQTIQEKLPFELKLKMPITIYQLIPIAMRHFDIIWPTIESHL